MISRVTNEEYNKKLSTVGLYECNYEFTKGVFKEIVKYIHDIGDKVCASFHGLYLLNNIKVKIGGTAILDRDNIRSLDLKAFESETAVLNFDTTKPVQRISIGRVIDFLPYLFWYNNYTPDDYRKDMEMLKSIEIDGYLYFGTLDFILSNICEVVEGVPSIEY